MYLIRFISAVLAFCLIATSAMTANLRIDPGTGQFVTICADGQAVLVEIDHTGAPLEPRHTCPDCISVGVLTQAQSATVPVMIEMRLSAAARALSQTDVATPTPTARAPPLNV